MGMLLLSALSLCIPAVLQAAELTRHAAVWAREIAVHHERVDTIAAAGAWDTVRMYFDRTTHAVAVRTITTTARNHHPPRLLAAEYAAVAISASISAANVASATAAGIHHLHVLLWLAVHVDSASFWRCICT